MRRDQDVINPRTHPDIMLHAHEDEVDPSDAHPYWYARVIGIFHVYVTYVGPNADATKTIRIESQRMEFVWVRWFGRDLENLGGFKTRRLHLLGFIGENETAPFGFVDPKEIIRGVHLMPAASYGRTTEQLGRSPLARRKEDKDADWDRFYVGMWVLLLFNCLYTL